MSVLPPSDNDIALVRVYVGSEEPPSDDDIYDQIIASGTAQLAAKFYLESRLGDLLTGPASFSVTGYSESNAANISALQDKIEELRILTGTAISGIGSANLVRTDRPRFPFQRR